MTRIFSKELFKDVFRAVLISICITIIGVLVFALFVKYLCLGESAVLIGNTVIKGVSVFLGVFLGLKDREMGALKGAIVGLFYVILSYFFFSIISGKPIFSGLNLVGMVFCGVIGLIGGIITVNLHK